MRVPIHIVETRREQIAEWLQRHAYAPTTEVCRKFNISEATARRDLRVLADRNQIVRTYGGALSEFNQRFASFNERRSREQKAKKKIAEKALALIKPDQTCYLDAGTTIYALAEALQQQPVSPLRIVTNSLPVAEILAPISGISVFLLGGQLLPKQSVLFGKSTRKALAFYEIDQAFIGAEGFDDHGLSNSQKDVVIFQRAAIEHSQKTIACLDKSKLDHAASVFLTSWEKIDSLITNADADSLRERGIPEQKIISV